MQPIGLALVVSITVSGAPDENPGVLDAIVTSCEAALGEGACTRSAITDTRDRSEPRLHALVHFGAADVTVEFVDERGDQVRRTLPFVAEDGLEQRLRAAGLLVAALAASLDAEQEEPVPVGRVVSRLVSIEFERERVGSAFVDLGAFVSPVWARGDVAFGGELRPTFFPRGGPIGLTAAARVAHAGGPNTSSLWIDASLGPTLDLLPPSSDFSWWLLGEAVIERVTVSLRVLAEESDATRFGGRLGTRIAYGRGLLRPWLAFEAAALAPAIEVRLDGTSIERAPALSIGASLGVRLRLLDAN